MNQKRIAALAFVASLAATTIPSFAATTGTVTVKWNTQALANIYLATQATSGGVTPTTAAQPIYALQNGGTGNGCNGGTTAGASGTDGPTATTVNYGNVTPDSANYTDCMEINAVEAYVVTNDTNGWKVQAGISAGAPAGYGTATGTALCILPNGAWANNLAYTASARNAASEPAITVGNACPGGDFLVGATAPGTTLITTAAATAGTSLNSDLELALQPNAPSGAQSVTVTYTLVAL